MITEHENIFGIGITYDQYVKREMEAYMMWMPFTYELARSVMVFINDNFYFDIIKPEVMVWIGYDQSSYRAIELSIRIKEAGYGEAELFTMDTFIHSYTGKESLSSFVKNFVERFQRNIIKSAVMEKIELYRNPPKPIMDYQTGLLMAKTSIWFSLSFLFLIVFIIYMCLI